MNRSEMSCGLRVVAMRYGSMLLQYTSYLGQCTEIFSELFLFFFSGLSSYSLHSEEYLLKFFFRK